ncbi:MAG: peptidylprolyl isomerase, partial [Bacteroidia bacterium]
AALIRKGLYTTSAEAKEGVKFDNTSLNLTYTIKRFDTVSDSAVKVTDADIQKYYNDHSYEFKNNETTRKVEYVAYNVVPSPDDLAAIEKDAQRAAGEFKGKNLSQDSAFIAQESQNGNITIQDFNKKSMIVRDSSIFTAPVGSVFGPYNEGAYFKIYKLEAVNSIADSAKVRHILIGTIDPQTQQPKKSNEQAKKQADSLLTLIKEKKVSFDTLVKTVSDDMGSKTNGGDYGWFDENKGFVQPFKDAGLMGTKGNISVVQTQFGYHIIEVLDVSKTRHNSYRVAQIFKLIAPSDETNQKIFAAANEFGGKHNTGELFDKGVREQKLAPRIADNIKESDRQLPGLESAKELVRWTYSANKGDVAVFSFNDKHIVAKLSGIKNKGTLPLEEVKEDVVTKVTIEKKAEMFLNDFKNKAAGSKTASEYAAKLGLEPKNVEKLMVAGHNIEGLGHDDILIGTALGCKAGQTSRPTVGDNGVFVLTLNNADVNKGGMDFKMKQKQMEQMIAGRADYEAFNALKDLADIEDHKSRVD